MKIKVYLDEDVHKKVAFALRLRGFDVVSAHEYKKWGLSDSEQIKFATTNRRAIFSFNSKDYVRIHSEYVKTKQRHFGIITSKKLDLRETIQNLAIFIMEHNAEEIENNLFWL